MDFDETYDERPFSKKYSIPMLIKNICIKLKIIFVKIILLKLLNEIQFINFFLTITFLKSMIIYLSLYV